MINLKIFRDYDDIFYSIKNKSLGNAISIIDNNEKYHYEFDIRGYEALITTDYLPLIETAINEFRKYNKYVNIYFNKDRSFYEAFDEIHIFKLPIKIIQPSKFFINEKSLNSISSYLEDKEVYLPVCIINDEYVLIDGHARLLSKYNEDFKMVNVYLDDYNPNIKEFVYMAKEHNITNITKLEILSDIEYNSFYEKFYKEFK